MDFKKAYGFDKIIYSNPMACESDVKDFVMEGEAAVSFPLGKMRLESKLDPELGQKSNFLFWCPEEFPDCIAITWEFTPIREPGLAMMFFAAQGKNGMDLFDPRLELRDGQYDKYHSGDINAFHASYFRRKAPSEREFQTCNLRKSYGFHLVAQGADPIPSVGDVKGAYPITIIKYKNEILFAIRDLLIYRFIDDGQQYGALLGGGRIGFRQMSPLIAEYSNLKVYRLTKQ